MVRWRFLAQDGVVAGVSEPFAERDAAEAWLATNWSDLVEQGFEEVELTDADTDADADGEAGAAIYRMSLAEE